MAFSQSGKRLTKKGNVKRDSYCGAGFARKFVLPKDVFLAEAFRALSAAGRDAQGRVEIPMKKGSGDVSRPSDKPVSKNVALLLERCLLVEWQCQQAAELTLALKNG